MWMLGEFHSLLKLALFWIWPPWPPPSDMAKIEDVSTQARASGNSRVDAYPEEAVICQLKTSSMFSIEVHIEDKPLKAVVDSAAEVTILSDRIYQTLHARPPVIKHVVLNTAARDLTMTGFIVGPVAITFGEQTFNEVIYTAPIDDDMLLGADLLRKYKAIIDIPREMLYFHGQDIPMTWGRNERVPIAQVLVEHPVTLPPQSVKKISCVLDNALDQFVIEPHTDLPGLIPRSYHETGCIIELFVINPTGQYLNWKQGMVIGEAFEASAITSDFRSPDEDNNRVRAVGLPASAPIPAHLQDLWQQSCEHLSPDQQEILRELLLEFEAVFARDEFDLGNFTEIEHEINTGDATPVKQRMRRTPMNFVQEERAHLNKMLTAGVIQPSVSAWASPPVLVRKRDGGVRWCIDYRRLNEVTKKDVYPLPCMEECLDTLSGNVWFSKLDANSAYWQVRLKEEDREKTAFITKHGLYEFVRMGFGLCNAPATFSRVMNLVLRGLNWDIALAFLDDVVVLGSSFTDHVKNLRQVLERFRDYKLKLKPRKCSFFQRRVEFLGREVDSQGLHLKDEHIRDVVNWPTPANSKDVERFLGLVNYHRIFLRDFADTVGPLYGLTGKQSFQWNPEHQHAFDKIKQLMTSAPVLALPNSVDHFILDTDASGTAIGAELLQVQAGKERVIAYGSLSLSPEQRRYCVTRRELLAVVRFTRQYRHYLLGKPFTVRTDHGSLTWLLNFREPQGQLARWLEELGQYDMKVEHRPGRKHQNADALSRIPEDEFLCQNYQLGSYPKSLPCGGCS